jgi:hypothetical protein
MPSIRLEWIPLIGYYADIIAAFLPIATASWAECGQLLQYHEGKVDPK